MKAWIAYKYVEDFCGDSLYYLVKDTILPVWSIHRSNAKIIYSKRLANELLKKYESMGLQIEEIIL